VPAIVELEDLVVVENIVRLALTIAATAEEVNEALDFFFVLAHFAHCFRIGPKGAVALEFFRFVLCFEAQFL
jgi:hypothetical protein